MYGHQRGNEGRGVGWGRGVDVYTWLCTEQRTGETCCITRGTLLDALWRPRREGISVRIQLMAALHSTK